MHCLDNYALARLKAKKAETTSDLSTDTETKIRKRKKLQFSSSESDMSDIDSTSKRNMSRKISSLPPPPKMMKQKVKPIMHLESDNLGIILNIKNIYT